MTYAEFVQHTKSRGWDAAKAKKEWIKYKKAQSENVSVNPDLPHVPGMPGTGAPPVPREQPGFMEKVLGRGEAAATMLSGAATGPLLAGPAALYGIGQTIADGSFGTREGAQQAMRTSQDITGALTYEPRTEQGQRELRNLQPMFNTLAPLEGLSPMLMPLAGARYPVQRPRMPGGQGLLPGNQGGPGVNPGGQQSGGAAVTPEQAMRQQRALQAPVPFEGDAQLTKGQLTRNPGQLGFENSMQRRGELGQPIRDRLAAQRGTFYQNLNLLEELQNATTEYDIDIGRSVVEAITAKRAADQAVKNDLYAQADAEGALSEPVRLDELPSVLNDLSRQGRFGTLYDKILNDMAENGVIDLDPDSGVVVGTRPISIADAETTRQVVNAAVDWQDPREAFIGKTVISAIDTTLDGIGNDAYKTARAAAKKMFEEYNETGITSRLISNKAKTSERVVPYENVFKAAILDKSAEEIAKLRNTLMATAQGQQAWKNMTARFIAEMRKMGEQRTRDEYATRDVGPARFGKFVEEMERTGKLRLIFGDQVSEQLLDLGRTAEDLFSVPNLTVGTSGTAETWWNTVDRVLMPFMERTINVPYLGAATRKGVEMVREGQTKAQVRAALYPEEEG